MGSYPNDAGTDCAGFGLSNRRGTPVACGMRLIPINSAEAVFEAFFDERISELALWTADAPGALGFKLVQGWCYGVINWERPAPDGLVLRVHRRYDQLDCSAYDRLLVCINLPEDCVIRLAAGR